MAHSSPEKRRAVRKLEAQRDALMDVAAKAKVKLMATRAALKMARKGRVT